MYILIVVIVDVHIMHCGIIGLDHQVEEEEEQEGTSAYFKQGISIILKSFSTTTTIFIFNCSFTASSCLICKQLPQEIRLLYLQQLYMSNFSYIDNADNC